MGRMPTARRPIIETVRAEAARIRKRQAKALTRLSRLEAQHGEDPTKTEALKAIDEECALTEKEIAALEAMAKIAALLERVKPGDDEEDEEKPLTPDAQAAALTRLDARTPPKPRPETEE
jgi:Ser/Thr protein kinase RdoA (MazF antagonist)